MVVLFLYMIVYSSGHWDSMEEYTCMIPRDTHDGAFYRAVLALHQDLFSLAQQVGYSTIYESATSPHSMHIINLCYWKASQKERPHEICGFWNFH